MRSSFSTSGEQHHDQHHGGNRNRHGADQADGQDPPQDRCIRFHICSPIPDLFDHSHDGGNPGRKAALDQGYSRVFCIGSLEQV